MNFLLLILFLLDYSLVPTPPNLTPGMGNEKKQNQQQQQPKPVVHPHPLPPRPHPQEPAQPKRNDLDVVKNTYIFGFPLVVMDAAERQAALKANQFNNGRAWVDLQDGPVVLEFGQGSFNLQLIDGWTRTLKTFDASYAGKKVAITQVAGNFSDGIEVIQIPTRMGLLTGTGGENVTLRPYQPQQSPVDLVSKMDGITYFNKLMALTQLDKDIQLNKIPVDVINNGAQQAFAQIKEANDKGSAPAEDNDLSRAIRAYNLFK